MQELLTYIHKISSIEDETIKELQKHFKPFRLKKNEFFVREG